MILRFPKIVLHNKITNENRSTKSQENSAHRLGLNREELELLDYALVITFFEENR